MSSDRRYAVRVALGTPGTLRYGPRAAPCIVIEASVTGARVRVESPTLLPNRLQLVTIIEGQPIALDARVRRSVLGGTVALSFERPDGSALPHLIAEVQRQGVRSRTWSGEDRRRVPREPREWRTA